MKKVVRLLIFIIILFMTACGGPSSSTASILIVVEKGHSSDYEEYWIEAYNPNTETKDDAFRIVVNEVMTWNLIMEDTEYAASYEKKENNPITLAQIEYSDKTLKKSK